MFSTLTAVLSAMATLPGAAATSLPTAPAEEVELKHMNFDELPAWEQDDLTQVFPAFLKSCQKILTLPAETAMPLGLTASHWQKVCKKAQKLTHPTSDQIRHYFEQNFTPYAIFQEGSSQGLFTGYYEPILKGSARPSQKYQVPLYGRPSDLVLIENLNSLRPDIRGVRIGGKVKDGTLIPYATRKEIDEGALAGQGLELAWVEDPIDAYFMAIQGSGVVEYEDGTRRHFCYAATNGHPYTSIGKVLVELGELSLDTMTADRLRAWLKAHPQQAKAILHQNHSFVFFKENPETSPIGAQGVPLTPHRSLAVDPFYIAFGTPLWLDIPHPVANFPPLRQLVVAQDTGSAIKGPIRGDFYWGSGFDAGHKAGLMKSIGTYYLLLPRVKEKATS